MWDKLNNIFTKSRLILWGKIAMSVVGAFAWLFLPGSFFSWVTGPLFGFVVLIWHAKSIKDFYNWRGLAFIIVTTLIWIIVLETIKGSELLFGVHYDVQIKKGAFLGSVFLPIAHAVLLGGSFKRTVIAIICVSGSFLLLCLPIDLYLLQGTFLSYSLFFLIPIWQAVYLVSMFGFRKKEQQAETTE